MMAQADPRRGVNAIAAFNKIWKEVQEEIQVPEGYTMKYLVNRKVRQKVMQHWQLICH